MTQALSSVSSSWTMPKLSVSSGAGGALSLTIDSSASPSSSGDLIQSDSLINKAIDRLTLAGSPGPPQSIGTPVASAQTGTNSAAEYQAAAAKLQASEVSTLLGGAAAQVQESEVSTLPGSSGSGSVGGGMSDLLSAAVSGNAKATYYSALIKARSSASGLDETA
ncbi:MAG TPA: hypothetical protein VGK27_08555 [Candidatus Deferrimicrobiaceae bacterium]